MDEAGTAYGLCDGDQEISSVLVLRRERLQDDAVICISTLVITWEPDDP